MAACFSSYIPLIIFIYTYLSAAMSTSILYRYLMSDVKYFECMLMYFAIDMRVSKKKYFRSQDINLAPLSASGMVLLNSSFDSKIYAAGDDKSSGYSILSPPTVSLTLYASGFSGS